MNRENGPHSLDGDSHLVGRLILAVADDDYEQTVAAIHEANEVEGGLVNLVSDVAGVAIALTQSMFGDTWRSQLVSVLNVLEINELEGGVGHE